MARAGAVWVDVLPSLSNFNALVTTQAQVSLDTVGAATGKGYGLSLTKGVKDGMSGMTAMVEAQAKAAGDAAAAAVDAAEGKVAAARKRSLDASGSVVVAETKLKDLREQSNASAGRLAAAEETVAKAQRNAQLSADGLVRSEVALTTAQERATVAAERQGAVVEASSAKASAGMAGFASSVGTHSEKITSKLGELGKGAAMMGGLFAGFEVAKFAGESIKASLDFEKSSQVLVNAAGESKDKLGMIKQGMLDISSATGTDLAQVSEGMYTIEKAGIRGSDGLKVMSDAAKLARDENADLGVVTNALTTVMATSNGTLTDSAKASNALMVAAGNSKTSLQEFAGSLSSVLPVSSKVGISFDQVSGAIGAMTSQGMSAQQAGQNLNNVIASFATPGRVAATEMQAFGVSAQDVRDNLGKRGLQGTIELLSDAVKSKLGPSAKEAAGVIQAMPTHYQDLWASLNAGTTTLSGFEQKVKSAKDLTASQKDEILKAVPASQGYFQAMSKMTGGLTGLNVSMMLTGSNADKFTASTKAVAEAMGNADEFNAKWNATQATAQVRLDQAKETIKAVGISLATNLLPYIADAAKWFAEATKKVVEFTRINWDWIKPVAIGLGVLVGAITAVGVAMKVWELITAGGTIGMVIKGVALLVVGVIYAYNHFETFRKIVDAAWAGIKTAAAWIAEAFLQIKYAVSVFFDALQGYETDTGGMKWVDSLMAAGFTIRSVFIDVWHALVAAWDGIYGAVESVVTWVTGTAWPAIQSAWKAIGDAAVWLWHSVIEPVWEGIKIAVAIAITAVVVANKLLVALWEDVLAPALLWLWHTVFEPVWVGIQSAVKAVGDWFSGTFWPALQSVFRWVGDAAMWLWHNVFEPVWAGIQTAVRAVVDWLTGTAWPAIQAYGRSVADSALWLWHTIIEPVWNGIQSAIRVVVDWLTGTGSPLIQSAWKAIGDAAMWLWHNVIEPAWNGIRAVASPVVDWFSGAVVGAFNGVRDSISAAFNSLKDTIAGAWNAIRDTAKAPIEFVVNTVFAGLVDTYNSVADKVGAAKFTVPHVQFADGGLAGIPTGAARHAGGGPVLGYSPHSRADNIPAWLTAEEFILPVAATRALRADGGDALLERLRTWNISGHADGGLVRGYADGGSVWDAIKAGIGVGAGVTPVGSAISAASDIGGFLSDPVGSFKALGERLVGAIPGGAAMRDLLSGVARKAWEGIAQSVTGLSSGAGAAAAPGVVGAPTAGQGSAAFEGWWAQAVGVNPALAPYHAPAVVTARNESGFNPAIFNTWDSNALAGTPSAGLMQFIKPTFDTYHAAGYDNWLGAVDQILAWYNYSSARYGGPNNIPGVKGVASGSGYVGYGDGGFVKPILFDSGNVAPPGLFLGENRTGGPERLDRRGHGSSVTNNFSIPSMDPYAVALEVSRRQLMGV